MGYFFFWYFVEKVDDFFLRNVEIAQYLFKAIFNLILSYSSAVIYFLFLFISSFPQVGWHLGCYCNIFETFMTYRLKSNSAEILSYFWNLQMLYSFYQDCSHIDWF